MVHKGKVIRNERWTKPSAYTPSGSKSSRPTKGAKARRGARLFPAALIALPLAAFTAIVMFPASDSTLAQADAATGFSDTASAIVEQERAYFPLCSGSVRTTCVVDGDTIWYQGTKIRLVGFDTPETSRPGCAREARLGKQATQRLQALLNEGAFTLEPNPEGRDQDRDGTMWLY